jgi:hypothetical protein
MLRQQKYQGHLPRQFPQEPSHRLWPTQRRAKYDDLHGGLLNRKHGRDHA